MKIIGAAECCGSAASKPGQAHVAAAPSSTQAPAMGVLKKPASKLQGILKKPPAGTLPWFRTRRPKRSQRTRRPSRTTSRRKTKRRSKTAPRGGGGGGGGQRGRGREEGRQASQGRQACQSEEAVQASPSGPQPLPQGGQGPFGGRLRPLLQEAQREAEAVLVEEV